jgi:hypothetical protein
LHQTLQQEFPILVVAFFAWSFAESVQIYLSTRTLIEKENQRLNLFYFIGWGIPAVVFGASCVLVYMNMFNLQNYNNKLIDMPLWLVAMFIGGPSALYFLLTIIFYIVICFAVRRNKDLLHITTIYRVRRVLICSSILICLHIILVTCMILFLYRNKQMVYHHTLAGIALLEGMFLIGYHVIIDKKMPCASKSTESLAKKRNNKKYSTQDLNGHDSPRTDATGEGKYLLRRSSHMSNQGIASLKNSPSAARRQTGEGTNPRTGKHPSEAGSLEWDEDFTDMYGGKHAQRYAFIWYQQVLIWKVQVLIWRICVSVSIFQ